MANKTQTHDPKSSPQARGKRLKTVRMMAGLTRNGLEKKHGISASTIQSWEAAKAGGLTDRGAQRVIPILRQEGISCSPDWLLYGIGTPPQPANLQFSQVQESAGSYTASLPEDKAIIQELLTVRELNTNIVDLMIADDGMEPHYKQGDYVAGKRRTNSDIEHVLGLDCIVETANNEFLLRRVRVGSRPGLFTLHCVNPDTAVLMPTLYDIQLLSAAPVIWHRRRDPKSLAAKAAVL